MGFLFRGQLAGYFFETHSQEAAYCALICTVESPGVKKSAQFGKGRELGLSIRQLRWVLNNIIFFSLLYSKIRSTGTFGTVSE
ncbi:MAG: hypothetical protein P8166_01690 [Candidatus Thiodiazotropha sp.]